MIDHDKTLELAVGAIDFELTRAERALLDAHLAECSTCRAEIAAIRGDVGRLRRLPPIEPPAWVARAIWRKRRPVAMLLIAAVLLIGGSIGAVALAGAVLDRTSRVPPSEIPSTSPAVLEPSSLPTLAPLPQGATVGWNAGPTMSVARAYHLAARLSDGRVLIAGGGISGKPIVSAEVYDPATNAFRPAAPMNLARTGLSATFLHDGRVLVAGGSGNTAELYDPVTDTWSLTGPMRGVRKYGEAILLLDGRVLVVGGLTGSLPSSSGSASAEIYDPATNTWTNVGSMSTTRINHSVTLLPNGRVLVAGGSRELGGAGAMDDVEIFDPATGTFTAASPMNHVRVHPAATLLNDGRVLVVGGIQGSEVVPSAELFDPASSTWTDTSPPNEPRQAFTLTMLADGRVLAAGGSAQGTGSAEMYDPAADTWDLTGEMTALRGYHTATLLLDGRVFVTGGLDESQAMQASTEVWLAGP